MTALRSRSSCDKRHHLRREALHFFKLGAALKEQKVDADLLESTDPFGDVFWRSYQPGAKPTVRH